MCFFQHDERPGRTRRADGSGDSHPNQPLMGSILALKSRRFIFAGGFSRHGSGSENFIELALEFSSARFENFGIEFLAVTCRQSESAIQLRLARRIILLIRSR